MAKISEKETEIKCCIKMAVEVFCSAITIIIIIITRMSCLMYYFLVLSLCLPLFPSLLLSSHHGGCTSVGGACHRLGELLDDELYQVVPVLAGLEALVKYMFSKVQFLSKLSLVQLTPVARSWRMT